MRDRIKGRAAAAVVMAAVSVTALWMAVTAAAQESESSAVSSPETETEAIEQASTETLLPPDLLQAQEAEEQGSAGADVVLLIDVSGSMAKNDPEGLAVKAALHYVDLVEEEENSRVGIVPFSDELGDVVPMTQVSGDGAEKLQKSLEELKPTKGDTDIGLALKKALELMGDDDGRVRQIVLLTDGVIDLPHAENEQQAEAYSAATALECARICSEKNIVIHTVALDTDGSLNVDLLSELSSSSGGEMKKAADAEALPDIYSDLEKEKREAEARAAEEKRAREESERESEEESGKESERESERESEQRRKEEESERKAREAETEGETEPLTEKQTEAPVSLIGSVPDPVLMSGILPGMTSAQVDLSELFASEGGAELIYSVYAEDENVLSAVLEGSILEMRGVRNGSTVLHVYADTASGSSADMSFTVVVRAVIPSVLTLAGGGALLLAAAVLIILVIKRERGGTELYGTVCWYVRRQGERVFGVPSEESVDLSRYGKRAAIGEFVGDERVYQADLLKVWVTAPSDGGIHVRCRSRHCYLSDGSDSGVRELYLGDRGQFVIHCEGPEGPAEIEMYYDGGEEEAGVRRDGQREETEERTRLLTEALHDQLTGSVLYETARIPESVPA